jgi:site-specific recombinase XerD
VRFDVAIDEYFADMRAEGRITSDSTVRNYRAALEKHAEDIGNRDPRYTNRDDVKATLRRWTHPNTYATKRSALKSFYQWTVQEGMRKDNPAEQTRPPRRLPPNTRRLTREEAISLLDAASTERERRALFLGIFAGLRNKELRGLQGKHFERPGLISVTADIAKRKKARDIPVAPELKPIVARIRNTLERDDYVLPHQYWADPGRCTRQADDPKRPSSSQALGRLMKEVAKRAGISGRIHPHQMRHVFGEQMARHGGMRHTQALLGHADSRTTEIYTGQPSLDDLLQTVSGFKLGVPSERTFYPPHNVPANPVEAPTGIEPV